VNIVAQYVRLFVPNVHQGFWREKKADDFFGEGLRWLMFTNRFDNHKLIRAVKVSSINLTLNESENRRALSILAFSIGVKLFIIRRSCTILNHGLSGRIFSPDKTSYIHLIKQSYVYDVIQEMICVPVVSAWVAAKNGWNPIFQCAQPVELEV
jgi:hypothetical protein